MIKMMRSRRLVRGMHTTHADDGSVDTASKNRRRPRSALPCKEFQFARQLAMPFWLPLSRADMWECCPGIQHGSHGVDSVQSLSLAA